MAFSTARFQEKTNKKLLSVDYDRSPTPAIRSGVYLFYDCHIIKKFTFDKDDKFNKVGQRQLFCKFVTWNISEQKRSSVTVSNNLSMFIKSQTGISDCGKIVSAFTGQEPKYMDMIALNAIAESIRETALEEDIYCKISFDLKARFGEKIKHFEILPDYMVPENRHFTRADCDQDKTLLWQLPRFQEISSDYRYFIEENKKRTFGETLEEGEEDAQEEED